MSTKWNAHPPTPPTPNPNFCFLNVHQDLLIATSLYFLTKNEK